MPLSYGAPFSQEGKPYDLTSQSSTPAAVLIRNPYGFKYLHVWLQITAKSGAGTGGIRLDLYSYSNSLGADQYLWADSAGVHVVDKYQWAFGPGLNNTPGAGAWYSTHRGHVPLNIPAAFYLVPSHVDANTYSYKLTYCLNGR